MAFEVDRTFTMPASEHEQEMLRKARATTEVASFVTGRWAEREVLSANHDADAVISMFEPFTRSVIKRLKKCRIITNIGIGYQNIDVEAATDCGVCSIILSMP